MRPFLRGTSVRTGVFDGDCDVALSSFPGDVGGRASGAELIE